MGEKFGKDKVDDSIERNDTGFVQQFVFDNFPTYETTDGKTHDNLEDARENQRHLDRTRK